MSYAKKLQRRVQNPFYVPQEWAVGTASLGIRSLSCMNDSTGQYGSRRISPSKLRLHCPAASSTPGRLRTTAENVPSLSGIIATWHLREVPCMESRFPFRKRPDYGADGNGALQVQLYREKRVTSRCRRGSASQIVATVNIHGPCVDFGDRALLVSALTAPFSPHQLINSAPLSPAHQNEKYIGVKLDDHYLAQQVSVPNEHACPKLSAWSATSRLEAMRIQKPAIPICENRFRSSLIPRSYRGVGGGNGNPRSEAWVHSFGCGGTHPRSIG